MTSHFLSSIPLLLLLLTALHTPAAVPPPISSIQDDINIRINGIHNDEGSGRSSKFPRGFNNGAMIIIVALLITFALSCSRSPISDDADPPLPVSIPVQRCKSGLDPAAIEAFPILTYSDATELKIGKETLECAICLCHFAEEEFLRMLPNCCHVFHSECVRSWLEHHVTCPVCRDNLAVGGMDKSERRGRREQRNMDLDLDLGVRRIGRSHSADEAMLTDRHKLVLPEHMMRELVEKGRLRRLEEVAVLKGGEGSVRRGLSDRWTTVILSRVSSEGDGFAKKIDKNSDGHGSRKDVEEGRCSETNRSPHKKV